MSNFDNNNAEYCVPDCLVFKFEEFEDDTGDKDTTLFVLYDIRNETYVIRGKRRDTPHFCSNVYSFECESVGFLVDFIQYLICSENKVNEVLYNYTNLPESSNDITFEFLEENCHIANELAGYNKQDYNNQAKTKRRLMNRLRMLKHIVNYF